MPTRKAETTTASPPSDWPTDSPRTIVLMRKPRANPPRLPAAIMKLAAAPSPTGQASSQLSSSIMGMRGMRKKELLMERRQARGRDWRLSTGQKSRMQARLPPMHTRMYFFDLFSRRCSRVITSTPTNPDRIGVAPTRLLTIASAPNHGSSRNDRFIAIALKEPKQRKQPSSSSMQFFSLPSCFTKLPKEDCEGGRGSAGGVGGLSLMRRRLGTRKATTTTNSTSMRLKVRSLPFWGWSASNSQPAKQMPGKSRPAIRLTFIISAQKEVTPARLDAWYQFELIFVWLFTMKGRPIPAMVWPSSTSQKPSFTRSRTAAPAMLSRQPTTTATLVPCFSMTQAAGKVKRGCMRRQRRPAGEEGTGVDVGGVDAVDLSEVGGFGDGGVHEEGGGEDAEDEEEGDEVAVGVDPVFLALIELGVHYRQRMRCNG